MKEEESGHIVIIGNGISGVTCARHIRKKSDARITIISSETDHHYSRTALMYIYMGHMRYEDTKPYEDHFWKKNRIDLLRAYVTEVNTNEKKLRFSEGGELKYDKLVIATGSKPNKFGWPGQELKGVQGLYSYQDLELLEENSKYIKNAVIVGGGLIGVELVEMLKSRGFNVVFLVREQRFWNSVLPEEEAKLIERHMSEHHVDLRLGEELAEILSDSEGRLSGIRTKKGEEITCDFVGLTAGVSPNIKFLENSSIQMERGVLVNEYFETNIEHVYAIGDCAQFRKPINGRRTIEQVWYTGKMHGETLASTITGKKLAYNPGFWFNSAKFFDIEYQTYGTVPAKIDDSMSSFYWEHESGKICLRLVYTKDDKTLLGVNVFGIRMRHHAFDKWLREGKKVSYIMEHLIDANFDPEFYEHYESQILTQFNLQEGTNIQPRKKSWKRIFSLHQA